MAHADPSPRTRLTVAEEVYRALKRDIIRLVHRPGASLTEHGLAATYGSSRVPVREACRRLQQEGLMTAIPYKGYFVNQISVKDITDSFELRMVLESHAVAEAARRVTPSQIEALRKLAAVEYTYDDWSSYAVFLERNLDFHIQVASLCGNERLVGVLHDLLSTMQRFFFLGLDLGDFGAEMRDEHEELVNLLAAGDGGHGAGRCAREQIESSRERIMRALVEDRLDLPLK
jgi:DNA-binding GntR family transcriptional regulator